MVESIIKICLSAGRKIMQVYFGEEIFSVYKKKDLSPVTSADLFSNSLIVSSLQKLTPDIPILSEENISLWPRNKTIDYFWVVDPLDGTKEFLSGHCEFTVNIAFIENGIPIIGVVYAPALGVLYFCKNNQVWKMDVKTQYCIRVTTRKLYPPVIVVSRFHNNLKRLKSYLIHLVNYKIITVGSSLKFCLIAEGIAQIYPRFSFTNVWDIAAGHAIALAAGAIVNDWSGSSLNYKNVKDSFLNSGFHVFLS